MFNKEQFDWIDFYKEFAQKLLKYKTNRKELIRIVECVYKDAGINMPTLELDNKLLDIDPFTIFGLFNKGITKENRLKIMFQFAQKLQIQAKLPTSFGSIPVLNNQNATFYYFSNLRSENDIDDLWNLFESALKYAQNPTKQNKVILSHDFDIAIHKKGNGNSKITMGLYWIAPNTFLNLDSRNEWYIYKSGKMPKSLVDTLPKVEGKIASKDYFTIIERLQEFFNFGRSELKNFNELSFEAWRYSEEVNEQMKREQKFLDEKNILDDDENSVHYWIYSPGNNASKWNEFYKKGIMAIGWGELGNLLNYTSKEEIKQTLKDEVDADSSHKNSSLCLWQFVHDIKPGDIIFVKKGMHEVIGKGVVESDYYFDELAEDTYKNVRKVKWTDNGNWEYPGQASLKTLTNITQYTELVKELLQTVNTNENVEEDEKEQKYAGYTRDDFLSEVYMSADCYDNLVRLLDNKKNIILQGAPGVGKTYIAKRLAYSIIGEKNIERVAMVQFHQSYSYEDFIMGFRPNATGFELKTGVFYNFCKEAEKDEENKYFFIIDEINRGNLSKIFGELFMLIENDKRNTSVQLIYNNEKFSVPKNVYIIGMMNTADRSLALLDYALRRRFAFFTIVPGFESEGFTQYMKSIENPNFNRLIGCVKNLNKVIENDETLGNGFCIGHSYFCNLSKSVSDKELLDIIEFEIIPLIKEYWFDEPSKIDEWVFNLRSSIK